MRSFSFCTEDWAYSLLHAKHTFCCWAISPVPGFLLSLLRQEFTKLPRLTTYSLLFYCCVKRPWQTSLGKDTLLRLTIQGSSPSLQGSYSSSSLGGWSHCIQRVMHAYTRLSLSFSYNSGSKPRGWCHPQWANLTSVSLIKIISHKHAHLPGDSTSH